MIDAENKEPSDFTTSCGGGGAQFPAQREREDAGRMGEGKGKILRSTFRYQKDSSNIFSGRITYRISPCTCVCHGAKWRWNALATSSSSSRAVCVNVVAIRYPVLVIYSFYIHNRSPIKRTADTFCSVAYVRAIRYLQQIRELLSWFIFIAP